jgi:hypothetical protein
MIYLKFLAPDCHLHIDTPSELVAPIAQVIQKTAEGGNEDLVLMSLFDDIASLVKRRLRSAFASFSRSPQFSKWLEKRAEQQALIVAQREFAESHNSSTASLSSSPSVTPAGSE